MTEQLEKLMSNFAHKMLEIQADPYSLERLNLITQITNTATNDINELLAGGEFENNLQERDFFKNFYPRILSHVIEEGTIYNLHINKPINTNAIITEYYEEALNALDHLFAMNNFHYQYFKNGFKELDHIFF